MARAQLLALLLPAALLGGAFGSQYLGGLYPCEMCLWQRWPHYAAVGLAALAYAMPMVMARKGLIILATIAIGLSGAIGAFHAGVEYSWWPGITGCTATPTANGGDLLGQLMRAPLVRCDVAPWSFAGISLAGFNALFSAGGAIAILALIMRGKA